MEYLIYIKTAVYIIGSIVYALNAGARFANDETKSGWVYLVASIIWGICTFLSFLSLQTA